MRHWISRHRTRLLMAAAGLLVIYALLGYMWVPHLVRQALAEQNKALPDAEFSAELIRFNPWRLSLSLENPTARIRSRDVAKAALIQVNINVTTLFRDRAIVFDEIRLEQPILDIQRESDGSVQLDPWPDSETSVGAGPVRILIEKLAVIEGGLHYKDASHPDSFSTDFKNLNVQLENLDTGPLGGGQLQFDLSPEGKGRITLTGALRPDLGGLDATLNFEGVQLHPLWRHEQYRHGFRLLSGVLDGQLAVQIIAAGPDVVLSSDQLTIGQAVYGLPDTREPWLELDSLTFQGLHLSTADRDARLDSVDWLDATLILRRLSGGDWAIVSGLQERLARSTLELATGDPWDLHLGQFNVQRLNVDIDDPTVTPKIDTRTGPISFNLKGLSSPDWLPETTEGEWQDPLGGQFSWHSRSTSSSMDVEVTVRDWSLPPWSGYAALVTGGPIRQGSLDADSQLHIDDPLGQASLVSTSDISIDGFALASESGNGDALSWQQLSLRQFEFATTGTIRLASVALNRPVVEWIIEKDGRSNQPWMSTGNTNDNSPQQPPSEPLNFSLGGFAVTDGRFELIDHSQTSSFASTIDGLSIEAQRKPSEPETIVLDGSARQGGGATANLKLSGLMSESLDRLDLKLTGSGIDLVPLTPYSGRYLGWTIDSGQLALELDYALDNDDITGSNRVVLDDFELADRVESDDDLDLPIRFALALMRDLDGGIHLDVPVSGRRDDPEFSLGRVISKAFAKLIFKAAASPFLLLSALVPDKNNELGKVGFQPGSSVLEADQIAAVQRLADVLAKRPQLELRLRGITDPEKDRQALQSHRLRQLLEQRQQESVLSDPTINLRSLLNDAAIELEPLESNGALTIEQLEALLRDTIMISEQELIELAKARAETVRQGFQSRLPELDLSVLDPISRLSDEDLVLVELKLDAS